MTTIKLTHRVKYDTVESDLVYPIEKGYYYVCQVDRDWMKKKLRIAFGNNIVNINNKYVVEIGGNLYYNHDEIYWLISND